MAQASKLRIEHAKRKDIPAAQQAIIALVAAALIAGLAAYATHPGGLGERAFTGSIETNGTYVAVMFWSETCPTCEAIMPYWRQIETSPPANVTVTDVEFVPGKTDKLFVEYAVTGTPTFIVLAPDGTVLARFEGAPPGDPLEYLKSWITDAVEGHIGGSSASLTSRLMGSLGLLAYPLIGVALAFSPCVAPVLAILAATGRAPARSLATCSLSAAAGLGIIAVLLATAAAFAVSVLGWLKPTLAATAIVLGAYFIVDSTPFISLRGSMTGGLGMACLPFGVLAAQCSLPLIAALILVGGASGSPVDAAFNVGLAAAGLAGALFAVLYLASKAHGMAERLISGHRVAGIASGLIMVVLGLYILVEGVI